MLEPLMWLLITIDCYLIDQDQLTVKYRIEQKMHTIPMFYKRLGGP